MRPVLLVAGVLSIAALAFLVYSCSRAPASGSFTAPIGRFPPDSVTYLAAARSYLVRSNDGSFAALSEVDADPASRLNGCVIRYRSDLSAAGEQGIFRDDCSGALFDREGKAIQDPLPPMQRHPVQIADGNLAVRIRVCVNGGTSNSEPCRE